jgi:YggT family protein
VLSDIGQLFLQLLQTILNLYLAAVLLRLLLQLVRADFYNPLSQFLVRITNPLLKPLRKVVPGLLGIDFAAVVLALLVQIITFALLFSLFGASIPPIGALLVWSVIAVVAMVVNIYFVAILVGIILSWVAPQSYHPAVILIHQLTEPVMAPFRRLLPPLGGLDLSPILVFLVINVVRVVLRHLAAATSLPTALVLGL